MQKWFRFLLNHQKCTKTLAIVWTLLILVACFIPAKDVPNVPIMDIDKLVHMALFGGCGLLWSIALFKGERRNGLIFRVFVAMFFFGIIVELLQNTHWAVGRYGDVWDAVADAVGAAIAALFAGFLLKEKNKKIKSV